MFFISLTQSGLLVLPKLLWVISEDNKNVLQFLNVVFLSLNEMKAVWIYPGKNFLRYIIKTVITLSVKILEIN